MNGNLTDKILLQRIAQKDEKAFDTLYEKYAAKLMLFAMRSTRDENFAKELVQVFWIKIWEAPELIKVDEDDTAYRYLSKYFTFRLLDAVKERSESKLVFYEQLEDIDWNSYAFNNNIDIQEFYAAIDAALEKLPEFYREIFKSLYIEEMSVKDTAKRFHINERTVNYRAKESIRSIQKDLNKWYSKGKHKDGKIEENISDLLQNPTFLIFVCAYFYL